jgi:hypothetical protein
MLTILFGATAATVLDLIGKIGTAVASLPPVRSYIADAHSRMAGRLPLPENQELVRTIRTAHLAAIDKVARRHVAQLEVTPTPELDEDEHSFSLHLRAWLGDRLKVLNGGALDVAMVDGAQIKLVLDDMLRPSAIEDYAEVAAKVRTDSERAALGEISDGTGREPPPLFQRLFAGEVEPGWFDLFTTFVSEQIKTNERFRSTFVVAELVDIKRLIGAAEANISEKFARATAKIDARLDSADAARERGIQKLLQQYEDLESDSELKWNERFGV